MPASGRDDEGASRRILRRRGGIIAIEAVDPPAVLQQVLPGLGLTHSNNRWIVCVAPPFGLSFPLRSLGIDPIRCRVVHPGRLGGMELIERALGCRTNAFVLAWVRRCDAPAMAALDAAARRGGTLGILFLVSALSESRTIRGGETAPSQLALELTHLHHDL